MSARTAIIFFVVALVALGIGWGLGMWYKGLSTPLPVVPEQVTPAAVQLLSSKIVPSVIAKGSVITIDDRTLTLSNQLDTKAITVKATAKTYQLIAKKDAAGKTSYSTTEVPFGNIKVGNSLEVVFKVLADGSVDVLNVIILPPTVPAA